MQGRLLLTRVLYFFGFMGLHFLFFGYHGSCNLGMLVSLLGFLVGILYQRLETDMHANTNA